MFIVCTIYDYIYLKLCAFYFDFARLHAINVTVDKTKYKTNQKYEPSGSIKCNNLKEWVSELLAKMIKDIQVHL